MKLYFITGNKNKLKEAREILTEHEIESKDLDVSEIQADPVAVARHKAREAFRKLEKPCFVEDTALCFNALNGLPGEYIKFFLEKIGREGLFKLLKGFKDKTGYAMCVIAYHDGRKVHTFKGKVDGTIVSPKGKTNFGWDPVFMPKCFKKTFAQMKSEEKNSISHRKRAFEKFKKYLK